MKLNNILSLLCLSILLASCAEKEDPRRPISHASGSFLKKSIELNKKLVAEEESIFDSIMKANPDQHYALSQKGYWFTILEEIPQENYFPQVGDLVYFDSTIMDVSGDTIYKQGELPVREYMVDKEEIIIGLRDGIKRLNKGDKAQFLFPSHVAYGYIGDKKRIGRNQPIIYNVTILDIKKQNDTNTTN